MLTHYLLVKVNDHQGGLCHQKQIMFADYNGRCMRLHVKGSNTVMKRS